MKIWNHLDARWRRGLAGAAIAVSVGLALWLTRLGQPLDHLSYDLLFRWKEARPPEEVVIVYIDEKSCHALNQNPAAWDRALHARLLDRLTRDQARLVVFDILFADPGHPVTNAVLAHAIEANGRVVLAATVASEARPEVTANTLVRPREEFRKAAAAVGVAEVGQPGEWVVRQFEPATALGLNLAWAAATLTRKAGSPLHVPQAPLWLNYYGRQGTVRSVSFCEVDDQPPGFFRNKVVFVGGRPSVGHLFEQVDQFRTPFSRWGGESFPGVELLATAFLNVHRGESLQRLPAPKELVLLILFGLVAGIGIAAPRRWMGAASAVVACGVVIGVATLLLSTKQQWFGWITMIALPVPCALGWSLVAQAVGRRAVESTLRMPSPVSGQRQGSAHQRGLDPGPGPAVPDHEMLQLVGSGAYGGVWLARNAVGMYRAVKVIHREAFETDDPYEREFRGIEKFMPISLKHPKLVHVLHVGRSSGYFYYIMEAGDDEATGQRIDPRTYSPRTLGKDIRRRGRLPVAECVSLGLDLAEALECLHAHQLIHRDLKPANIIFVEGVPKIADIGLVTHIGHTQQGVTYVGTEGFIPPEGPGTAAADVYGLGKVLYAAATGLGAAAFPEVPPTLVHAVESPHFPVLNGILLKACEPNPTQRYQTAAQVRADLLALRERLG